MTRPHDHDDTFDAERLLLDAGRRPELDEEHLETIREAFRAEWRARQDSSPEAPSEFSSAAPPRATGSPHWRSLAAVAALAVAVLGLGWWWVGTLPQGPSPTPDSEWIAQVVRTQGDVRWQPPSASETDWRPLETGQRLPTGARLRTASDDAATGRRPGATLRLGDGEATLRLDQGSRVTWHAEGVVDLERGALYADSGVDADTDSEARVPSAPSSKPALTVRTPFGVVTEVGTQFEVRLPDDRHLRVRVREGMVHLTTGSSPGEPPITATAQAGETLLLDGAGNLERGTIPVHGPAWDWVVAGAPAFAIEGRTLSEFLAWVARETGWTIRIPDPDLARQADTIVLHGSMGGATPDRAPGLVLPAAGLRSSLDGGTLSVAWADSAPSPAEP